MKTRLIFLVLLIVCFSCGTNNKPVSDAQKEKIKGEVKEAVNTFLKGAEEANFEMVIEPFLNSPDFVYISNGKIFGYRACVDTMKVACSALQNQKGTVADEKYVVLDNSTVLYTANSKWLMNLKDGSAVQQDPWMLQLLFKKMDSKWKIINFVESGYEKIEMVSKELNHYDLKQSVGTWKCEVNKDTTYFRDFKSYGTGFVTDLKVITKGKTINEWIISFGYVKEIDKYVVTSKGQDVQVYVSWFTSKNKMLIIPYGDIVNPEKASWKMIDEYLSPDKFVETSLVNNKLVKTCTFTRVK